MESTSLNVAKVKMLGTTNRRFEYKCGTIDIAQWSHNNGIFWFGDFHTSYVVSCKINETVMTLQTRNSVYTFELLNGLKYDEFELNEEQIKEMEKLC